MGSEMCIRDRLQSVPEPVPVHVRHAELRVRILFEQTVSGTGDDAADTPCTKHCAAEVALPSAKAAFQCHDTGIRNGILTLV